jgi:cytochrome P450
MTAPRPAPDTTGTSTASPSPQYPAHQHATPLHGPRFQNNPAQLYRDIRRQHGPVAPVLLEGDVPAWLVLGYRELHEVTSNSQLYARDSRRWNAWDRIPPDWPLLPIVVHQPSSVFAEGADHQRRAGAINDVLAAVDQFELKNQCERIADKLVDTFAGVGEADLVNQYARPIPLLAVAWMLGLPGSEASNLVHDMYLMIDGAGGANDAHQRINAGLRQLIVRKHENPGPDAPSRMLAHPEKLTDDEIATDLSTLLLAGQQPTADWIGNALRLMLTDNRFAMSLSGGRGSVGQALNQVLWADTPAQNFPGRWAAWDTQLGGRRIRVGDLLVLSYAAANADPQVHPASGTGGNHAHMSFSHGEHGCPHPARELAEIIAQAAVEVLLDRLPDVRSAVASNALVWRPSLVNRGLSALPVKIHPRARHRSVGRRSAP